MKSLFLLAAVVFLAGCASTRAKPEVGQCIRKDTKSYRERVYKVLRWEADGTPEVKDMVTGKVKPLLDYKPKKYRLLDCPPA